MNIMKRMMAAALLLCMVLSLCACGGAEDSNVETTEAPVETTTAPLETENVTQEVAEGYRVTVVDEEGNPIVGAMVQLCLDACMPGVTNADGVAVFSVEEADYKVSMLSMPEGYAYSTEEEAFYFEDGSMELTIVLKAAE